MFVGQTPKLLCGGSNLLIKGGKCRLKIVSEIRENIGVDCWCYLPTECNPADIVTRCYKRAALNEVLWFKRASFLKQDEKGWPRCKTIKDISENVDEKEVIVATNLTSILQAAPIHSKSSPQLPSIRINVDKE